MALETGIKELDTVLRMDSGIIAIRSEDRGLLDELCRGIAIRSVQPGKKTLILHFSDYHERYWAVDIDSMVSGAIRLGVDPELMLDSVEILRVFSRDGVERDENWKRILEINGLGLAILDSVSDLYLPQRKRDVNLKAMLYMISQFGRLCAINRCVGLALDCSDSPVHPYLGELASVIVRVQRKQEIIFELQKHPMMAEARRVIWKGDSLRRWM